jgi:hypothetical protein
VITEMIENETAKLEKTPSVRKRPVVFSRSGERLDAGSTPVGSEGRTLG